MKKWINLAALICTVTTAGWAKEIVPGPIQTPWDAKAAVAVPFPEYPRMQLVRDEWQNLNGKWDYAITSKDAGEPAAWEGKILVPFCIESELSGVNRAVSGKDWVWYRRTFEVSNDWKGRRVWLNFQASDWETVVYVNGREVGTHQEGYTPFAFDITDYLKPGKAQELVVRVWDHQGKEAFVSAGKQYQASVYEPCSGIWQTVWLEPRAAGAVTSLKINGSLKRAAVELTVAAGDDVQANVQVLDGKTVVAEQTGAANRSMSIAIPNPKAWEPDNPFLYDLRITLLKDGKTIDSVKSYCGLRDIWIDKARKGPQIVLNGKAFFHFGPLDQGYWPLSGLTPPTEEAQEFELKYLKDIGCNMVRLHIKRNPSRWYYYCDKYGLLVWQDFICNRQGKRFGKVPGEMERWKNEQVMLINSINNHPSVVKWIVFNEAWGQQDTEKTVKWAQGLLPNHIISAASGWTDVDNLGDIRDIHDYSRFPSVTMPHKELNRAVVLGETGGFGVPVNGNNWLEMPEPRDPGSPDGRVPLEDRKGGMSPVNACADHDFINDIKRPVYSVKGQAVQYARYIEAMHLEQTYDLSGAVYTQLTDMRHEQNGWLTFDRKVSKIPVEQLKTIHETLYQPVPGRNPLVMRGAQWTSGDGKTVVLPFTPIKNRPPRRRLPKAGRKNEKAVGPMALQTKTATYRTEFEVKQLPQRAALNIFMESEHDADTWKYLRIFLDGELIFDDMSRYKNGIPRNLCAAHRCPVRQTYTG